RIIGDLDLVQIHFLIEIVVGPRLRGGRRSWLVVLESVEQPGCPRHTLPALRIAILAERGCSISEHDRDGQCCPPYQAVRPDSPFIVQCHAGTPPFSPLPWRESGRG